MRRTLILFIFALSASCVFGQDFSKSLSDAKSSYQSGNLDDARFAMQQMLNDLDIAIGKEVMKLLPSKMEQHAVNATNDNVTANTGFTGVLIHRDYGTEDKMVKIDIMGNSPLVGSLNAILSMPFIGNSGDGTQKQVKVQGYKGILQKSTDTETNKTEYTLQIPLNSSLLTLVVPDSNEGEVMKMVSTIPVGDIAKMVQ
ncbi:MAG TPA: hypothetical protein VD927_09720 [Chryseosolibacter sp.]|nr:hypothetical protein [Chryseosolibacter sp.]